MSGFYSGCDTVCIEDIIAGHISVPGIHGEFDYWEWRVDGLEVESGSGAVEPLLLTQAMIGSITLFLQTDGCEKEMQELYIEAIQCSDCPSELTVTLTALSFIPVFGDADCDEYVYSIEGAWMLPSGFIYCDELPEFEGGYIVYEDVDYVPSPFNMVTFEGHLYVTDFTAYSTDSVLYGQMLICDTTTNDPCPADVSIHYVAPMNGMMCNFSHCIDATCPCSYSFGDPVPVRSCMTLQFPACTSCDIDTYYITVYRPQTTQVIFRDTIEQESEAIGQEYCMQLTLPYNSTYCYPVHVVTNCGDSCLSSICLWTLSGCSGGSWLISPESPTPEIVQSPVELTVYPNPNDGDILHVVAPYVTGESAVIEIYALDGTVVHKTRAEMHGTRTVLQTAGFQSGTYLVCLRDPESGTRAFARYTHIAR